MGAMTVVMCAYHLKVLGTGSSKWSKSFHANHKHRWCSSVIVASILATHLPLNYDRWQSAMTLPLFSEIFCLIIPDSFLI